MAMGKLVFAQIMEHLPLTTFRRCVARYGGAQSQNVFLPRSASLHGVRAASANQLISSITLGHYWPVNHA